MRRVLFVLLAFGFLGTVVGCRSTGSGCDTGCGSSCSTRPTLSRGGCGSGGCGIGSGLGIRTGCGTGSCGTGSCAGKHAHSHGICDCDFDDYCASRAPWIRLGVHSEPAVGPAGEPLPPPVTPKNLPEVKTKKL